MKTDKQVVVKEILDSVRSQVLHILDHDPDIDIAFEGCQSNGEAAARMYRTGGPSHFRLLDGARDMVLALACLQLGISSPAAEEGDPKRVFAPYLAPLLIHPVEVRLNSFIPAVTPRIVAECAQR